MAKKRTKSWLIFSVLLIITALLFALAACSKGKGDDGTDIDTPPPESSTTMNFSQYMNKINTGLKAEEEKLASSTDYHVVGEYTAYSREENLTVTYEAVYRSIRRNGEYFIRIFDNKNHIERLIMYYDAKDLYVTVADKGYVIEDFGTMLIFDGFNNLLDIFDIGDLICGKIMQEYFSETTILSGVIGIRDLSYGKTDVNKEKISINNVKLDVINGTLNAQVASMKSRMGTSFDALTEHFLGFSLSRLLDTSFSAIGVNTLQFLFADSAIYTTSVDVSGRMQDGTTYFVKGEYAYDYDASKVAAVKELSDDASISYERLSLAEGSLIGTAEIPSWRETDSFDFALDYSLDPKNNANNDMTIRVYDQLATTNEVTAVNRYDNIKEIVSAYYENEILYFNTEGAYNTIGNTVTLNALRLPKVYFEGLNISSVMTVFYADMLHALNILGKSPDETTSSDRVALNGIREAVSSDVEKQEISFTVTEKLIKEIKGEEIDLNEEIAGIVGVSPDTMKKYLGNDFFELLQIVITYNFRTHETRLEVFSGTELIATVTMHAEENFVGVRFPYDLNELNYTRFKEPEVVTLNLEMTFSPYGAERVDLSGFIGAFMGDASGKNTPYIMTTGNTVIVRGKTSEYYINDASGVRKPIVTMDLAFYSSKAAKGSEEKPLMTVTTNPYDINCLLVELFTPIGTYDGSAGGTRYKIDRRRVTEQLERVAGEDGIFSGGSTALATFLSIYNAAEKNAKTYTDDEYFCVDVTVTDVKDPISEIIGIEDTNARIKCKITFETLDLSAVNADRYSEPYIHTSEDVSVSSIYTNGSKWKETATVTAGDRTFKVYLTYNEDSINVITGRTEYTPTAEIFGKQFSYGLHILNASGTYLVRSVDIPNDIWVIDPAFTGVVPRTVGVVFEGGEDGVMACEVEGFSDSLVTNDGYNLSLLAGVTSGMDTYKLVIGRNSIATIEKDIYIAVINRKLIPLYETNVSDGLFPEGTDSEDFDEDEYYEKNGKELVYVNGGVQYPIVAQYQIDPYTSAMTKYVRESANNTYDYLAELLRTSRDTVRFKDIYGTETDEKTGKVTKLRYNQEGYNWFFLDKIDATWTYSDEEFSYLGEVRYATAVFGDEENGTPVRFAVEIQVKKKIIDGVIIDDATMGQYTIDYLKGETYDIPDTTDGKHTVVIQFTDGTRRIVSLTQHQTLAEEEYCSQYFRGSLSWAGVEAAKDRLMVSGTNGLFGENTTLTNVTRASFGGNEVIRAEQTVLLEVLAPNRALSDFNSKNVSLVTEISDSGEMGRVDYVSITHAKFTESSEEYAPFEINPYNTAAVLPDTIWLYVPTTMSEVNPLYQWIEYPVEWLTTRPNTDGSAGKELNIIKRNGNNKFVLAHPVVKETRLVVYGLVGNGNGRVSVTMSLLNLASDIQDYSLYLSNGNAVDRNTAVSVDPYLSYVDVLPSRYLAVLGSGLSVQGETDWYYGDIPLKRSGKYEDAEYDNLYDDEGYYIFPAHSSQNQSGQYQLTMTVSEGEVSNLIYISLNVDSRDIHAEYTGTGANRKKVTDYVDIFATGKKDRETYRGEPSAGYRNVSYYLKESSTLLDRIRELLDNDGRGIVGLAFEQTGMNLLYAKNVHWNTEQLEEIEKGLTKASDKTSFTLSGKIDEGKISETRVQIVIGIDSMTQNLTEIVLTKSEDMRSASVYKIANDLNKDGAITVVNDGVTGKCEGKDLVTRFHRPEQYAKYFGLYDSANGTPSGDDYSVEFENLIFFDVEKVFKLSTQSSGVYASPYDYFSYLFGNMKLMFTSGNTVDASAVGALNLGERSVEYFNASLLGLRDENIYTESDGKIRSYAFLILERLSEGSAVDRTLVIITAEVANVSARELQREDEVILFNEDLTEAYPGSYGLPSYVDVVFRKADGSGTYEARYATPAWLPETNVFGSMNAMTSIEAKYINVTDGCRYIFTYILPDTKQIFYLTVVFGRKNINGVNYDASARSAVYDITNGKIHVENAYTFFTYDVNAKNGKNYVLNKAAVPTVIFVKNTDMYTAGRNDSLSFNVKWEFNDSAAFDERIFATGTDENGILIAEFTFDSYYNAAREACTQTLRLYLVIDAMVFTGIESEEMKVIASTDTSTNVVYNTIVIDPYNDTVGVNGSLRLPNSVTLLFNGNQRYTFSTDVSYKLYDTENKVAIREVTRVGYNEKGHTFVYDYTPNPLVLSLMMYVRGYSLALGTGIYIEIQFLERTIMETLLPNKVYRNDGKYVYEYDESGNVAMVNGEPAVKTYNAYADYEYVFNAGGEEHSVKGTMPIYYIDPYNAATFALPTSATFGFKKNANDAAVSEYAVYSITGWQYYDVLKKAYIDFPTMENDKVQTPADRFYQVPTSGGREFRGYFNPGKDSYAGAYYSIRGYITVGDARQYFDIVCIVLNRSLRTSAILKDEYTVSYDFADPVAAMLADIPSLLGADAFVNFDRYNDSFEAQGRRAVTLGVEFYDGAGYYLFTVGGDAHFSQKDENGIATNSAVLPEILWDGEYDTDGDGVPDTLFEELTTIGFVGEIGGNLYAADFALGALFEYYGIKVNYDYNRLINALMWDSLFTGDGNVSNSLSPDTRAAIERERGILEQQTVYVNYKAILSYSGTAEEIKEGRALSDEYKQTLSSSLLQIVLQEINRKATLSGGKEYSPDDEDDMRYIAYMMYLNVKEEYDVWAKEKTTRTAKVDIFEVWQRAIDSYRSVDVKDSRSVSANQILKSDRYMSLLGTTGAVTIEEKNKLISQSELLRGSLYVSINADLWKDVYAHANAAERLVMLDYENRNATSVNPASGISIACDKFKNSMSSMVELGTKGEEASADISIPVITYKSMVVEGGSTAAVRFNKFNFQSIDKEFVVVFEVSYEAIYEKMIREAYEKAKESYRDEKKSDSLTEFEKKQKKESVDALARELDEYGRYIAAERGGYKLIDGLANVTYDKIYDEEGKFRSSALRSFATYWDTLYRYNYENAIKIITANIYNNNVPLTYDALANGFTVSKDEVDKVLLNFELIKVPEMARSYLASIENKFDFDDETDRRRAVNAVATYVAENRRDIDSPYYAFEALGLDGAHATSTNWILTDEMWADVSSRFIRVVFPEIARQRKEEILFQKDTNISRDRMNVIVELADYIVSADAHILALEELLSSVEREKRAEMITWVLNENTSNSKIRSAAEKVGGMDALFNEAFRNAGDLVYDLLLVTEFTDNNATQKLVEIKALSLTKARKAYIAMNCDTAELRRAATAYFEFVTGYTDSNKGQSACDAAIDNASRLGDYTREQFQTLVQSAKANETYYNAIVQLKDNAAIKMSEESIRTALKKMSFVSALQEWLSTTYQRTLTQIINEAYVPMRAEAANRLMTAYKNNAIVYADLRESYDSNEPNGGVTENLAYYAFVKLVENANEKGSAIGAYYEEYRNEYIATVDYKCSEEILIDMQNVYNSIGVSGSSLVDSAYLANTYFGAYFAGDNFRGGELGENSIVNYGDDYYDVDYLSRRLSEISDAKGIVVTGREFVISGYMKDTLLRALVYFYDNLATDMQRDIVAEVSEMHIGVNVTGDLERAYITAASTRKISGFAGAGIYTDLQSRDDLGADALRKIRDAYYRVWLDTIMESVEMRINGLDKSYMNGHPFNSTVSSLTLLLTKAGASENVQTVAENVAEQTVRRMMWSSALKCLKYTDFYENAIEDRIAGAADDYAYDKLYEARALNGEYLYRDALDEILEEFVKSGSDLDRLLFEEAQAEMLEERLSVLEDAVSQAMRVLLQAELYDKITLLSLSADEFAERLYTYLTGNQSNRAAQELFGEHLNGTGGILGRVLDAYTSKNGPDGNFEVNSVIEKLTEWWITDDKLTTVYGRLGVEEQQILAQIHKQAYYQTNDLLLGRNAQRTVTLNDRTEIAYMSMMSGIYLFLCDVEEVIAKAPRDYIGDNAYAPVSDELKAYIIDNMMYGDLMRSKAHSLSFAQAKLVTIATLFAQDRVTEMATITSAGTIGMITSFDMAVEKLTDVIISASGSLSAGREMYLKYLAKAISYAEYTSVLGSEDYDRNADITVDVNPLRKYVEAIYINITGKDLSGVSNRKDESKAGMLPFAQILEKAGGRYANVFVTDENGNKRFAMSVRDITVDGFVSQDHVTEDDLHVVYFDRVEWDRFLAGSGADVNAYYQNQNIFIGNPQKTEKFTAQNGRYYYTNSFIAAGFEFDLDDVTDVDLYFRYNESDPYGGEPNILMLDALAPELPTEVYAKGYIGGRGTSNGIELGRLTVLRYSDEFKKLVYKRTEATEDPAYTVELKTSFGMNFQKIGGIKVGYYGRNVEKIYLDSKNYCMNGGQIEIDGDFVNMYSLYDDQDEESATYGKNVIFIDPINKSLLLTERKSYILPSTVAVDCGEDSGKLLFTDVEWDISGVKYGLKGTGENGYKLNVKSYRFKDSNGNERLIELDARNGRVKMTVFDKDTGAYIDEADYVVNEADMLDWNSVLVVGDRTVMAIKTLVDAGSQYEEAGILNDNGEIDMTEKYPKVNPFSPDFPTKIRLELSSTAGDGNSTVDLDLYAEGAEGNETTYWLPEASKFNAIKLGEAEGDYTFVATFTYLGYEIKARFMAESFEIPQNEVINGGVLYMIKGNGSAQAQFENNYKTVYYNFGGEGPANWQEVPVYLVNAASIDLNVKTPQRINGYLGTDRVDSNIYFTVKVIELENYAQYEYGYNTYVSYDFYSVASDGNKKAKGTGDSPAEMGETFIYLDGERRYFFEADNTGLIYDFIDKTVSVPVKYGLDDNENIEFNADPRIAYNGRGDRQRGLRFIMPMKTYERSEVSDVEFETDDEGKKWRWTTTPKTSPNYRDAIYWEIGRSIRSGDLPTVKDKNTGAKLSLMWDLTNLNINRANVQEPGRVDMGDGTVIYGYYMIKSGQWQSIALTVYIEKIDIRDSVLAFTKEDGSINGSMYIEKTYDSKFYVLPFDSEIDRMKFLRDDGTYEVLTMENFVVEYCEARDNEDIDAREWTTNGYPLNAGVYYIRVRMLKEDYNVYIGYTDGYVFRLTVKPYEINMDRLKFAGEGNNRIEQIYNPTAAASMDEFISKYLVVLSGLPMFTPANWFEPGEKEALYDHYFRIYFSEERAKAEVYRTLYMRVSDSTKEMINNWYRNEGTEACENDPRWAEASAIDRDYMVKAWVFDNRLVPDLEVGDANLLDISFYVSIDDEPVLLEYPPSDCGTYIMIVGLNAANTNFTVSRRKENLTLEIKKDTDIKYDVKMKELVYNGGIQNPEISNLHINGVVPLGVKVTYDYTVDNYHLVVIAEGVKSGDSVVNKISIDEERSTVAELMTGIKDAGEYKCVITVEGGSNYIDGAIEETITIKPAEIYLSIDKIERKYLSEVADVSEYLRVYNADGEELENGKLLGTDKLSDLGDIALRAEIYSYYRVGQYYTHIDGIKTSSLSPYTYTRFITEDSNNNPYKFMGERYYLAALKESYETGSLYGDAEGNKSIIALFKNYNIYVRKHVFALEAEEASGIYRIEQEEGSDGVQSNQELQDYIANMKDGETYVVYLSPITDDGGSVIAYEEITVNAAVNLTLIGYMNKIGDETVIETRIKGIKVLKGTVTVRIVAIEATYSGAVGVYAGEAGNIMLIDSTVKKTVGAATNTVGIRTSVNYNGRILLSGVTFEGLSLGLDLVGGELEIENCTFYKNYNGIRINIDGTAMISIKSSMFSGNTGAALSSVTDKLTLRSNTFNYNRYSVILPEGSTLKGNPNNGNVYEGNSDD